MPKSQTELLEDVESAKQKVRAKQSTFLRASGWTYTCETPGCYWMWQKALPDGRLILTIEDHAVRMEEHLMPDLEAETEEAMTLPEMIDPKRVQQMEPHEYNLRVWADKQAIEVIDRERAEFKNFHRLLCERFGYPHDPVDWRRDQLSLIEHIAASQAYEVVTQTCYEPREDFRCKNCHKPGYLHVGNAQGLLLCSTADGEVDGR